MTHNQIIDALMQIRPGAEWNLVGDTLDDLVWLDESQKKPTKAEIQLAIDNPIPAPELSLIDKLASIGIKVEDLKALLGI